MRNESDEINVKAPSIADEFDNRKTVKVSYFLDKKSEQYVQENYYDVIVKSGFDHHNHPISALERKICENKVHEQLRDEGLTGPVHDIGGSPVRNLHRKNVHSSIPILSAADEERRRRVGKNKRVCHHLVQDCHCIPWDQCVAYVAIHSLYYLTQGDILDLIWRGKADRLIAAVHTFDNLVGTLNNGEIEYVVDNQLQVQCTAKGNHSPYRHDSMQWLKDEYYTDGYKSMVWTSRRYNDTMIVNFYRTTLSRPEKPLLVQLTDYLLPMPMPTGVQLGGFVSETVQPLTAYGFGSFVVWVKGEKETVVVPKELIVYGRKLIMTNERTPDSLRNLAVNVRKYASQLTGKDSSLEIPAETIWMAVKIAFLSDVGLENSIYKEILGEIKQLKAHSKLRNFEDLGFQFGTCRRVALVAGTVAGAAFCHPAAVAGAGMLIYDATSGGNKAPPHSGYMHTQYRLDRTSAITVNHELHGPLPTTNTERPLQDIKPKNFYREVDMGKDPVKTADSLHKIGPGFMGHIPIVYANNQHNSTVAVINRCLSENPTYEEGAFESINPDDYIDCSSFDEIQPVSFKNWNKPFPKSRREQHTKALKSLSERPIENNDLTRESFVKVEKYNKSNSDCVEYSDPRLIQGVSARANVILGPPMKRYAKFLKHQWDGYSERGGVSLYYFCDNNEAAGRWMEHHLKRTEDFIAIIILGDDMLAVVRHTGKTYFVCNDFSRFDKTIQEPALNYEQKIYEKSGYFDKDAIFVLEGQRKSKGVMRTGIIYQSKDGRNSGDPNTSCGNSTLNGITSAEGLKAYLHLLGTDKFIKALELHYSRFGFVAKPTVSQELSQVDFCSKLFWPTADGIVLGPKPGRCLPKMGYSCKKLSEVEILSTMRGWLIDGVFVPGIVHIIHQYFPKAFKEEVGVHFENVYSSHCTRMHEPNLETSQFFQARYGVSTTSFLSALRNAIASKPSMIECEMFEHLYSKDN